MKKLLRQMTVLFAIFVLISTGLIACGGGEVAAPEGEGGPEAVDSGGEETAVEPAERKVATFVFTQEWDSLNPIYTNMWFSTITTQIWNAAAWDFDAENNLRPVLVSEIPTMENGGLSDEGRVITINLRDDIMWSDGEPITAEDFLFTYEMTINPSNTVGSTYPYDLIESVEIPDEQTVIATFADPFVPWAATLWTYVLPEHTLRPVFDAEGTLDTAEWNRNPVPSAGPFVMAEWESGSFARFEQNPSYYGDTPNLDEIFIRFVPDDAGQIAALRTGEADLGTFISYSDVPTLQDAGVNIASVPSGYNEGWFIHFGENAHPALSDVKVRQAIAMGFDRFAINEDLLLGLTEPAVTFWDNSPYAPADLEAWPYDPEMANALLDEAGWVDSNGDGVRDKDGVELVLVHGTTTREVRADTQAVAQQQLAEIGIKLDIQGFDSSVFFASYGEGGPCATGELDICEMSNSPSFPDPNTSRWLCSEIPNDEAPDGNNDQWLCDEELDALFQQQSTQVDFAERQATFDEISRIMYENVYWLGIWRDPDIWALSGRLTDTELSGATPFYNIVNWDIAE
ncbi:MAG: peptide ABC transporter substrate-binding protein [Ardenticatenaceae bacterium]|nr:peptide ABC transporter substrate-binding protein [Ardenticatenaceae bacterium]